MDKPLALQKVRHVVPHHWEDYFYFFNTSWPSRRRLCLNSGKACTTTILRCAIICVFEGINDSEANKTRLVFNWTSLTISFLFFPPPRCLWQCEVYNLGRQCQRYKVPVPRPLYASLRKVVSLQYLHYFAPQTFASMPTVLSRDIECEGLSSLLCHLMAELNPRWD